MSRHFPVAFCGTILLLISGCAGLTDAVPPSPSSSNENPTSPPPTETGDGPWILGDSCGGQPPIDNAADLEELEALSARLPTPEAIGPGWNYGVYDRGAPCQQFSANACTSGSEFDVTIDDLHRAAADYAREGVIVMSVSVNAETEAEQYVTWMADTITACPLDQPVTPPPGPGAADAVTTMTAFDEAGVLGEVSICRQYTTVWDGGAQRSDEYTCHVAAGTTRAWLSVLVDQGEPLSRDDAAAALRAAAASVFSD